MMDNLKFRKILILFHLLVAGFMAPAFILVAITGGLHMVGGGEKQDIQPIILTENSSLDFNSKTIEADVRTLLKSVGVNHNFEYLKNRGTSAQTRPTSRQYVSFKISNNELKAELVTPNFQKAMMEIHKGHGPKILRSYHKLVALLLFTVVLGGILVGLMSKIYRKKTIVSLFLGSLIYVLLIIYG
jgi:hypothetical protein